MGNTWFKRPSCSHWSLPRNRDVSDHIFGITWKEAKSKFEPSIERLLNGTLRTVNTHKNVCKTFTMYKRLCWFWHSRFNFANSVYYAPNRSHAFPCVADNQAAENIVSLRTLNLVWRTNPTYTVHHSSCGYPSDLQGIRFIESGFTCSLLWSVAPFLSPYLLNACRIIFADDRRNRKLTIMRLRNSQTQHSSLLN